MSRPEISVEQERLKYNSFYRLPNCLKIRVFNVNNPPYFILLLHKFCVARLLLLAFGICVVLYRILLTPILRLAFCATAVIAIVLCGAKISTSCCRLKTSEENCISKFTNLMQKMHQKINESEFSLLQKLSLPSLCIT